MSNISSYFAYVGARTTKERNARGNGLNAYRVDESTGAWNHVQLVSDLVNPSFLAFDRTRQFLYAVHGDFSEISAFAIDSASGRLTFVNRQSTGGQNPVHLSVDPTNTFVVVANHVSSTLALLPIEEGGSLGPIADLVRVEGDIGPHRLEQQFAKPHQVEFDPSGRFIIVPNKGVDRIFSYRFEPSTGKLILATKAAEAREGSGPRHIAFHPTHPLAYVVNELDSTVSAHRFDPETGALQVFQIVSTLPDTFTGNSRSAEIAASSDGRFIYASNRGYDSIAVFGIDPATGRLSCIQWIETGKRPDSLRSPQQRVSCLSPTKTATQSPLSGSTEIRGNSAEKKNW